MTKTDTNGDANGDAFGAPVKLPVMRWGEPDAARQALLLHGLTSSAACWWQVANSLSAYGWCVTAPDLRGHGLAPPAERYDIAGYAGDVAPLAPLRARADGARWDVVVGHSLGGVVATAIASRSPRWAARLVLLDPVITLTDDPDTLVREGLSELRTDMAALREANPRWHPEDVRLKVLAAQQTSAHTVEATFRDNAPYSYEPSLADVECPVDVLAADENLEASFTAAEGRRVAGGRSDFTWSALPGVRHSVYRDDPDAVVSAVLGTRAGTERDSRKGGGGGA